MYNENMVVEIVPIRSLEHKDGCSEASTLGPEEGPSTVNQGG